MESLRIVATVLLVAVIPAHVHAQARVETNVVYGMYSGLALLMDVYHPENPNGLGVVLVPGSGWHQPVGFDAEPLNSYQNFNDRMGSDDLLSNGYTLFAINHRAAPVFRYPAAVEDVQRAVRFVRYHAADYGIDARNIGALGGSSGAHLASLLGVLDGDAIGEGTSSIDHQSAKVQAVVALSTPTDLAAFQTSGSIGTTYVGSFVGFPAPLRQIPDPVAENIYREASPITHVTEDDAPILLIHGDSDGLVPYSQAEQFHSLLVEHGVSTDLVRIADGNHILQPPESDGPSTDEYYPAIVAWFDEHLRAKE